MKYVAIDVETSGLQRDRDQILEFAAVATVLGDNSVGLYELPLFHTYVTHDRLEGNAYALMMNADAIRRIALKEEGYQYTAIDDLADAFYNWCVDLNVGEFQDDKYKIVIAGKNYGMFDDHFTTRIPKWFDYFKNSHRVLEPNSMFLKPGDKQPPSLSECLARAGLDNIVKHTAASDAYQVIELYRSKY